MRNERYVGERALAVTEVCAAAQYARATYSVGVGEVLTADPTSPFDMAELAFEVRARLAAASAGSG